MKTEFIEITETQKNLVIEIPGDVVTATIERLTRDYGKAAKIPGFRPGKAPAQVIRKRYREQILHDVVHELVPRAVDEALRERGLEPVDTPNVKDVIVEEGRPLTFTAAFETVPPIDPGEYAAITLRKTPVEVEDAAVDQALERLRERAARFEPVEDRPVAHGDTVVVDLERTGADGQTEKHENVSVEVGAPANPPGFDAELTGLRVGDSRKFTLTYPGDYAIKELAGSSVAYAVAVRAIKRRVVLALDDEFAKDLGDYESLEALRGRVREDLEHQSLHEKDRELRAEMLRQLASRVGFDAPASLVDREIDRRVEDFVRRLIEQQIDPMRTNINWEEFRDRQREPAAEAVRGALVLDEVARRENLTVDQAEVTREVERYAERTGRSVEAVHARLEKEGGIARLYTGLRREKAIDFLLTRVTIVHA
ncbi:MAG TPA: trigger factor [Vicinamibacterales bacterium]|jgi:trigger factor|nr:trigger factor [Vicinamibacterales bacterium]